VESAGKIEVARDEKSPTAQSREIEPFGLAPGKNESRVRVGCRQDSILLLTFSN